MAEPRGLEPPTFRVTGGRSNQLSYGSMHIKFCLGSGEWNCTTDLGLMSPTL